MGLWPNVFNLATKALISSNATCGERGREEFCRMSEGSRGRCGICDNFSPDPGKRHHINYAIDDGTNRWWQSPALHYGDEYEHVDVVLDLKQVYQVAYVIVKAANSPRPGAWILERSIDGVHYSPWQYFATSDKDCLDRYGIPARKGKPHYFTDSEVICTSFYSKLMPMENGEIHTFLIHGRPGANDTSPELLEFTKARYVRLRLQGFRGKVEPLPAWLSQDIARDKRLYYSIRDISIGGQCVCNGHASSCRHNVASGHPECECSHHTCGPNCDRCCPLFNQRHWGPGTSRDSRICLPCNCHGHAKSCHYDEDVDRSGLSMDVNGYYQGGGVCDNCTRHTSGINCEKCSRGYYRPKGTSPSAEVPCVKCDCDPLGSNGHCVYDAEEQLKCECRVGFKGARCEECADGFRGYPICELCPCDSRGVVSEDCESSSCSCKAHVDGKFCNHCKPGYFALQTDNPEGCSACWCSGATTVCQAAHLPPKAYETGDGWLISDISVTEIEEPTLDERNMISVGNFEIPGIEAYYWLAPKLYLGNKLEIYGSNVVFKVHWVVIRGDTSGKPTKGPNIIIVGNNGMRIASGDDSFTETNMTFKIKMAEYGASWYHIPFEVKDIVTRLRRTEYKGDRVTRSQFLSVLADIKHILLRAKFHTDQIEGSLEGVVMYSGNFQEGYSAVEQCSCPSGYTGLSCESCQYGYVRIFSNTSSHQQMGFCVKCDCNGHSKSCNPDTGECFCEHNTVGETCERCAPGYYGNPLVGMPDDCRKCACPLMDEENNFSPSCQLDSSSISNDDEEPGYVCTQCPKGYTGDHCEICDDGYFGIPSKPGSKCEPCSCGGGPCDRVTGRCLSCRGNTEGWKCERCKSGFYGDPVIGCEACLCDLLGSTGTDCNNVTGECECREHFVGRTCNKCEVGYGNVTAHCTPCVCDPVGAKSNVCDPHSGLCDCRPGVEGFRCDACQHLHYGFSEEGCQSCKCNKNGSELFTCDIRTGQCRCKPNYVGRTCDRCKDGYWDSPEGCVKCDCDPEGSESANCDQKTGRCFCRPGVHGKRCDSCKPGYYGFSKHGCRECDVCNKVGHICDPNTGRCVCPPNSYGEKCSICKINTWGHEPNKGCKACNCSDTGSIRSQCNLQTGVCFCRQGYTDYRCNRCEHGYYGYPKCRRCSCNFAGTDKDLGNCDPNGVCQCNADGMCPCKTNVSGKRCNHCKDGTFGLHVENNEGCTQCFCFGRSTLCKEAGYTWSKLRGQDRSLAIDFIDSISKNRKITSNDILSSNNFEIIEEHPAHIVKAHDHFDIPLYWKLPSAFHGDHVLSYGGYLRFTAETQSSTPSKSNPFARFPLVHIEGNGVKLYHDTSGTKTNKLFEVRLHESQWKSTHATNNAVSRDLLMVALQNVTGVYIKATDSSLFEKVVLKDVTLDTAIEVPGNPPPLAVGVEKCECPKEYSGTSCQNPNVGYYRDKSEHPVIVGTTFNSKVIDAVVGKSVPCQCNNRSNVCNIETGECLNCTENTAGSSCERCSEGFYGDPMEKNGRCLACPCPSETHNFAVGCSPQRKVGHFICKCKQGYFGPTCDQCSKGYYGQPLLPGGRCMPCNCNKDGRTSAECDQVTGQCSCKPGITGLKCSQCEKARHVLENRQCTPCDNCTVILLDEVDKMTLMLKQNAGHLQGGALQPPWESLNQYSSKYFKVQHDFDDYLDSREKINLLIDDKLLDILDDDVSDVKGILHEKEFELKKIKVKAGEHDRELQRISEQSNATRKELHGLIKNLNKFGQSHISTKEAVARGQKLLAEIEGQFKKVDGFRTSSQEVLLECAQAYDTVESMVKRKRTDPAKLHAELKSISGNLHDMEVIINEIRLKNEAVNGKNEANEKQYHVVKEKIKEGEKVTALVQKALESKGKVVKDALGISAKLQENHDRFIVVRDDLDELTGEMEEREKVMDENIGLLEVYRQQIEDHARDLEKNVSDYKDAFHLSNKELKAVKASGRYKEMINILNEANDTVNAGMQELDQLTMTTLKPKGVDSIYDKTSIAVADSERLVARTKNIQNQLPGFNERLNKLYGSIEDLKSKNWENGLKNNNHSDRINRIKLDLKNNEPIFKKLEATIKSAVAHSDEMRRFYKDAANINISMQYGLIKNYQKYLNLTSSESVKGLQENIKVTRELLQNISSFGAKTNMDIIKGMDGTLGKFRTTKNMLDSQLQNLRALVKKARQRAEVIRVPLKGVNCSRAYRIENLEPTTLSVDVHFTSNDMDGGLLHISNDNQYLNLRVDNRRICLSWKFVSKEYELCSKEQTAVDKEIKVKIERINNLMNFHVNKELSVEEMNEKVTLFYVTPSNLLRVGTDAQNRPTGLPGCLKDIVFNSYRLGLWEFEESSGDCVGCHRNDTIGSVGVKYLFNGEGYILDKSNMEPNKISVQFKASTFDENALLFLAYHMNTYMAITIQNGFIQCEMHYNNKDIEPIILRGSRLVNNGVEVTVECLKIYDKKQDQLTLKLNKEPPEYGERIISRSDLLKIKKADLYYGGLPPNFQKIKCQNGSFLGTLNEVLVDKPLSLQNAQYYGVELFSGKDVSYKKFLFDTNGFIKLQDDTENVSEINFILRTESTEGVVLRVDQKGITFKLLMGKIVVEIDGTAIESTAKLNDDKYHLVQLKKQKKSVSLIVDETLQTKRDLKQDVPDTKSGLVYIGGLENQDNKFRGSISDIIFRAKNVDKFVYVNSKTYLSSKGAKIGRSAPPKKRPFGSFTKKSDLESKQNENDSMKDMQQTDGCDKISYSLEPNAVKFGDAPNSFVQHNLKDSFWKNDYSIEFEFRTYYRNGMIFFAYGPKDHFNLFEIKDGKVQLNIKGKRNKKVLLGSRLDDGNWHHVALYYSAKTKRKLSVEMDGEIRKVKIPQNKVYGKLFFGDIPVNEPYLPMTILSPFRGCIRSLKINNSSQGLINHKNTLHNNIGQCFPNIEKGSYFRGDSYAVFSNFFRLSNYLEVSFSFRTSEQNGIFFSISNIDNSPALSIELQAGAVVLSVDMGTGSTTNVTNNISKYTICNNKWHHVRATFSTELTVNVDGVSQSWVLSDMGLLEQIEAPLYIGGLPDYAPGGTLKVRENFKGCISNLIIANKNVDWTSMEELNNISLNSCPVLL